MSDRRLRASVCMAVHNGERFLQEQLESILCQMGSLDEFVAIDDASRDSSYAMLSSMRDDRVRLHRNADNLGALRAFEQALRLASGEVILLSDQDDVWHSRKLAKIIAVFEGQPDVTMVVSDATIVDQTGRVLESSFLRMRGGFAPGVLHNFVKNKCLGCTMAFRRSMLEYFLPIPLDVPMHDIWFAVLNGMYGKTALLDEPLVAYRRHGGNVSPLSSPGLGQALRWRWRLAKNLALRMARGRATL